MNKITLSILCAFYMITIEAHSRLITILPSLNVLHQFKTTSDIFIIKDTIDLRSQCVYLPINSTLRFLHGGLIKNGILFGNNSDIEAGKQQIFSNIKIEGEWQNNVIYSQWVDLKENGPDNLRQVELLMSLCRGSKLSHLYVQPGTYYVSPIYGSAPFVIPSNVYWHNEATIKMVPCNYDKYNLILVNKEDNVTIDGGVFVGDLVNHLGKSGEWGHGIKLAGATHVKLKNLTCREFWGDGIDIIEGRNEKGVANINCDNILIDNVKCLYNRRQGLSLEAGSNVTIQNCEFAYTGMINYTWPCAGIDIEPWNNNCNKVWNLTIKNSIIHDNKGLGLLCRPNVQKSSSYKELDNNICIYNCEFENVKIHFTNKIKMRDCIIEGKLVIHDTNEIEIEKSSINNFENGGKVENLKFKNCTMNTKGKSSSLILSISVCLAIGMIGLFLYNYRKKQHEINRYNYNT